MRKSKFASANLRGLLASVCLIGLSLIASPVTAFSDAGPLATLPSEVYDFGRVIQGQKVIHEFEVRNAGNADLVLQRIAPSCGCTAAAVTSPTIKPGSTEKVRVTFDTSGMYGDKTKTVSILTNARENPELTLKLKGTVTRGLAVTPERVVFGELSRGSSPAARTQEIALKVNEDVSWEIAKVSASSPYLKVAALASQGAEQRYSVTVQPEAPKGELRERLLVEFKDTSVAPINVPVTATVLGDLNLTPSIVSFGIVSGSQPIERRIKYECNATTPVSITSITTSDPAVTASMIEMKGGNHGVLAVKLDPTKVSGDLRATIQLKTTHPEQDTLTLSVYGVQPPK